MVRLAHMDQPLFMGGDTCDLADGELFLCDELSSSSSSLCSRDSFCELSPKAKNPNSQSDKTKTGWSSVKQWKSSSLLPSSRQTVRILSPKAKNKKKSALLLPSSGENVRVLSPKAKNKRKSKSSLSEASSGETVRTFSPEAIQKQKSTAALSSPSSSDVSRALSPPATENRRQSAFSFSSRQSVHAFSPEETKKLEASAAEMYASDEATTAAARKILKKMLRNTTVPDSESSNLWQKRRISILSHETLLNALRKSMTYAENKPAKDPIVQLVRIATGINEVPLDPFRIFYAKRKYPDPLVQFLQSLENDPQTHRRDRERLNVVRMEFMACEISATRGFQENVLLIDLLVDVILMKGEMRRQDKKITTMESVTKKGLATRSMTPDTNNRAESADGFLVDFRQSSKLATGYLMFLKQKRTQVVRELAQKQCPERHSCPPSPFRPSLNPASRGLASQDERAPSGQSILTNSHQRCSDVSRQVRLRESRQERRGESHKSAIQAPPLKTTRVDERLVLPALDIVRSDLYLHKTFFDFGVSANIPYFRACEKRNCLVDGQIAVWRETHGLCIRNSWLGSMQKLQPIVDGLMCQEPQKNESHRGVRRVELVDNDIKDRHLAWFFAELHKVGVLSPDIYEIRIVDNPNMGGKFLQLLVNMMEAQKIGSALTKLHLGGAIISHAQFVQLFATLETCAPVLSDLCLSYTGLGQTSQLAARSLAKCLRTSKLIKLDISGNHLAREGLDAIGLALQMSVHHTIEELDLNDNAGNIVVAIQKHFIRMEFPGTVGEEMLKQSFGSEVNNSFSGMNGFCEYLNGAKKLRILNLRNSQLTEYTAFVLACSMCTHANIKEISLAKNIIGERGVRALLRLVLLNPYPPNRLMETVDFDQCIDSKDVVATDSTFFQFSDPSGQYCMNLVDPYARSVVLQCLYRWEMISARFDWPYERAFVDVFLGNAQYIFKKNAAGWIIPTNGCLAYFFVLPFRTIDELTDVRNLAVWPYGVKKPLTDELFSRFFRSLGKCKHSWDLSAMFNALAMDYKLNSSQVRFLASKSADPIDIMRRFLTQISDPRNGLDILSKLAKEPRKSSYVPGKQRYSMKYFCGQNPTGHYILDLAIPLEFIMGEQLRLINAWEIENAKMAGIRDMSQHGNYQLYRNEKYQLDPHQVTHDWEQPDYGVWEFDFSWIRRPSTTEAVPMSNPTFEKFCKKFRSYKILDWELVLVLKMVSAHIYVNCWQLRQLLECVEDRVRSSVFTIMFFRNCEYQRAQTYFFDGAPRNHEIPGVFDQRLDIEARIGCIHMVDPIGINKSRFRLNLSRYEERVVCTLLMTTSAKEMPGQLSQCFLFPKFGSTETNLRDILIPNSWGELCPFSGFFEALFSSENTDMEFRQQLWRRVCCWE
eukprot:GEMP01001921.1.p1 GENE.GEMP01001921.1~~GEMP01001921.1.p1  ORF type:complete len:1389 (+),score=257.79 GEMP01001921.1:190-4356(+)